MAKICPNCSKELDDAARFCDRCGQAADVAAGTAPLPVSESAPLPATPAPVYTAPEKPVYAGPTVPCSPDRDAYTNPDAAVPLQHQPDTEKKNKFLGLGVGISVALIALILALIAAVTVIICMAIPKGSDAKTAVEKYAEAYINNDFRYYYTHDYFTVFQSENVDEMVNDANKDAGQSSKAGLEAKVLSVTSLSDDTVAKIRKSLENNGCKSVDKIEDIKAVVVQTAENSAAAPEIGVVYSVKVNGDWYIAARGY